MRGEVVNLGNKAWGIPCSYWKSRHSKRKSLFFFPPNLQLLSKLLGGMFFVEMWSIGGWRGSRRAQERRMKADFLLAVLALRCISCPTTAEWDGWLNWTINIAVFNWCHITLFLSPEEYGSNQAVWVWFQSNEQRTWRGWEEGLQVFRLHYSCLERLWKDVWVLLHH